MTKNDAYDAFFKKDDNRTILGGLDKEQDSLLSYEDQLSLDQKKKNRFTEGGLRQTKSAASKGVNLPITIQNSKMRTRISRGLQKSSEC